jgi:hypothetical protein
MRRRRDTASARRQRYRPAVGWHAADEAPLLTVKLALLGLLMLLSSVFEVPH